MKNRWIGRVLALAFGMAGLLTLGSGRAEAGLIVSVPTVSVLTGSTGTFDILLQNTGGSAVSIGGFSFGVSTTNPGVTFSLADVFTVTPYIFDGNSLFGPEIDTSGGTSLIASDSADSPASVGVAGGATVGLGRVSYVILNGATAGTFAITLSRTATSLATDIGGNIPITTFADGSINVASVPEPASVVLVSGLVLMGGILRRKR